MAVGAQSTAGARDAPQFPWQPAQRRSAGKAAACSSPAKTSCRPTRRRHFGCPSHSRPVPGHTLSPGLLQARRAARGRARPACWRQRHVPG